jgi:hypothetical protein
MDDFEKIKVDVNFIDGPRVEILDTHSREYLVEIYEKMGDEWALVYANHESHHPFTWFKYLRKFRTRWRIKVWGLENGLPVHLYQHTYNERGKNVLLRFDHDSYKISLEWLHKAEQFKINTGSFVLVESKFAERLRKDYAGGITIISKQNDIEGFCNRNRIYACFEIGKHDIQSNMWDFWESKGIFENHASYYDSWHHPHNWIGLKNENIFDDILGL